MWCTVTWEGSVDVEERRVRIETLKCGSVWKAERMEGPRWPPAPTLEWKS
jgi:hypothetical protein